MVVEYLKRLFGRYWITSRVDVINLKTDVSQSDWQIWFLIFPRFFKTKKGGFYISPTAVLNKSDWVSSECLKFCKLFFLQVLILWLNFKTAETKLSFKRKRKQIKILKNLASLFLIETFTRHLALNNRLSPPHFFHFGRTYGRFSQNQNFLDA